jgi:hypothetical protein
MVVISMSMMRPKVIGKEAYLHAKGPSKLSKDLGPKKKSNTWRKEESKEMKEYMKMEEGGVHHKKYEGRCMKQWIIIPKATWTSPILVKRSTCWTSFNMAFFIKDDVNDEIPNGTPKNYNPSNGMVN